MVSGEGKQMILTRYSYNDYTIFSSASHACSEVNSEGIRNLRSQAERASNAIHC